NRAPVAGGEEILPLLLRRRRRDARERNREPVGNVRTFCGHGLALRRTNGKATTKTRRHEENPFHIRVRVFVSSWLHLFFYAATGWSGNRCSWSGGVRNAALFAIMGSIVSILTMRVVFTTAAISGAAMSGAIALPRSAAPSVDSRSSPSSPSR